MTCDETDKNDGKSENVETDPVKLRKEREAKSQSSEHLIPEEPHVKSYGIVVGEDC